MPAWSAMPTRRGPGAIECPTPFHGGDGTYFHENVRLKWATLSKVCVINRRSFRKGAVVRFDPQGKLIQKDR